MIDLNAIKARLAAITPASWRRGSGIGLATTATIYGGDRGGSIVAWGVAKDADTTFIANAPTDLAALVAEVERLRAVLDGPPICACGGDFDEQRYEADEDGNPPCYLYACQNADCGWQIGNNGEIVEQLTLRTNPQTARFVARIFGLEGSKS